MKKFNSALIIILTLVLNLAAQDLTVNDIINEGRKTVKAGFSHFNDAELLKARGLFERALSMEPKNEWARYYQFYTDYRLTMYYMQQEDKDDMFDKYSDLADDEGKSFIEDFPENAEAKALLCSLYGLKITKSWIKAPILGSKSGKLIEKALELEPENPRILLQAGVSKYNTPGFFGGSKEKGVEYFKAAIEKFKSETPDSSSIRPDWGYMETYAWLVIADMNNKEYDQALSTAKEALDVDPDFSWIKNKLLPKLETELSSK